MAGVAFTVVAGGLPAAPAGADERCFGRVATIHGGAHDVIRGTDRSDVIVTHGGNDVAYGLGGDDDLCGQDADDRLYGGAGADHVLGGAGDDVLVGAAAEELVAGEDVLQGGDGNDVERGGANDDVFVEGGRDSGSDDLTGEANDDRVDYSRRRGDLTVRLDRAAGDGQSGEGDDVEVEHVTGGTGDDTIVGDGQPNVLRGGPCADLVSGLVLHHPLLGGAGGDVLRGGDGKDDIAGGDGRDECDPGAGGTRPVDCESAPAGPGVVSLTVRSTSRRLLG